MAIPTKMVLTPSGSPTLAMGASTDASSEFWQRVVTGTGNVFIVYENVPYHRMQNLLQSGIPDTAIALQLAGYPKRVASV